MTAAPAARGFWWRWLRREVTALCQGRWCSRWRREHVVDVAWYPFCPRCGRRNDGT